MALNTRLSVLARNVQLDTYALYFSSGFLKLYDGTQPSFPDSPVTSQNLLASLRFSSTAFTASVSGTITASTITDDTNAAATGTATWFRCLKSDGTTVLMDGSIGTSSCNINMNSTAIQQGAQVSITSFTHSLPMQGA